MPKLRVSRRSVLGISAAVLGIALGIVLWIRLTAQEPILKTMDIAPYVASKIAPLDGAVWTPSGSADEYGFYTVLEQKRFALRLHPESTQIGLVDKRSGRVWYSNPHEERLKAETVKGLLRSNLESPFIMEFYQEASGKSNRRELTNFKAANPGKEIVFEGDRVQVTYTFAKEKIRFSLLYELTDFGLQVSVPSAGIVEEAEYRMLTLSLLPFFGSADAGTDGYFLVPDGPGGLIRFLPDRDAVGRGYTGPIYGEEIVNELNENSGARNRGMANYPVFGAKHGESGFLAIVTAGKYESRIRAFAPGSQSGLYNVFAQMTYREEYLRKVSRIAAPVKAFYDKRVESDFTVQYRLLDDGAADYVRMGAAYRNVLFEEGRLDGRAEKTEQVSLELTLVMGDSKHAYNRDQYVPVTTFEQAGTIVRGLAAAGVSNLRIVLRGWQQDGMTNTSDRFPIEGAIGGEDGAKAFIADMHELGFKVIFADDFVWADSSSSMRPRGNGARGIEETVYFNWRGAFILKPEQTLREAYQAIRRLKAIGADGIHFDELGGFVYRDFEPGDERYREEVAYYYRKLLTYAQQELDNVSIADGFDYVLPAVDRITDIQLWSYGSYIVDETVPFYPIALHGYIQYSSWPGNRRDMPEDEFLRAVEYGALPAFMLTYDTSKKLRGTSLGGLFTSRYENWKDDITAEYGQFQQLASLYGQPIVNHDSVAPGIYRTYYEDGTIVVVDYNRRTFTVKPGGGDDDG